MGIPAPTYDQVRAEYEGLFATMQIKAGRQREADTTARKLLAYLPRYKRLEELTRVPAAFLIVAHSRESDGDWNTYLGNGESLHHVTQLVPKGRGPFPTFEAGAVDATHLQGLDVIGLDNWSVPRLAYWLEAFNGFGYRMFHHCRSPYLWGGTNQQQLGKYTADNVYSATVMDPQLGGMALYAKLIEIEPSLALGPHLVVHEEAIDPPHPEVTPDLAAPPAQPVAEPDKPPMSTQDKVALGTAVTAGGGAVAGGVMDSAAQNPVVVNAPPSVVEQATQAVNQVTDVVYPVQSLLRLAGHYWWVALLVLVAGGTFFYLRTRKAKK